MATFTPPTVLGVPSILPTSRGVEEHLFRHVRPMQRGVNVFKMPDGSYLTDQQPRQLSNPDPANHADDAVTPVITYYGGHSYQVSDAESAALTTAGFGAYLSAPLTDPNLNPTPGFGDPLTGGSTPIVQEYLSTYTLDYV